MKKWWQSKTVWFNVGSALVLIGNEIAGKLIPTEYATTVVLVGNVILRFVTTQAVEIKGKAEEVK